MALDGEFDEPVDDLRKVEAGSLPHLRFYQRLLPLIVAAQYEWNGEQIPKEGEPLTMTGDK